VQTQKQQPIGSCFCVSFFMVVVYHTEMEETIHNNVYELRTAAGWTQEEFAQLIGVTRQTIISIEKGNYVPSVLLALKIATQCNCTVEDIFKIICTKK
jgi:putative transcriptional regulator